MTKSGHVAAPVHGCALPRMSDHEPLGVCGALPPREGYHERALPSLFPEAAQPRPSSPNIAEARVASVGPLLRIPAVQVFEVLRFSQAGRNDPPRLTRTSGWLSSERRPALRETRRSTGSTWSPGLWGANGETTVSNRQFSTNE